MPVRIRDRIDMMFKPGSESARSKSAAHVSVVSRCDLENTEPPNLHSLHLADNGNENVGSSCVREFVEFGGIRARCHSFLRTNLKTILLLLAVTAVATLTRVARADDDLLPPKARQFQYDLRKVPAGTPG